jgi:ADP-L-glycero-D-manno-heptose 6-epimerase
MNKLIAAGYEDGFYTLEQGVEDYVKNYLMENKYY